MWALIYVTVWPGRTSSGPNILPSVCLWIRFRYFDPEYWLTSVLYHSHCSDHLHVQLLQICLWMYKHTSLLCITSNLVSTDPNFLPKFYHLAAFLDCELVSKKYSIVCLQITPNPSIITNLVNTFHILKPSRLLETGLNWSCFINKFWWD